MLFRQRFQYRRVGRILPAFLQPLAAGQFQLVKQNLTELLGRVDVEGLAGAVVDLACEGGELFIELAGHARQNLRVQPELYAPVHADLNVPQGGPLYPNYDNIADLLAAGVQPLYLVHALLDRRFDGVELFGTDEATIPADERGTLAANAAYTSSHGRWEEHYMWKLNEVIKARYVAEPGLPRGVLGRRPGPERAAWMSHCFGPFAAAGASFWIHRGGGFWCSFAPGRLQLVRTPAALSEVVTTQPARLAGTLAVSVEERPHTRVDLVLEGGGAATWTARVAVPAGSAHGLTVSTYLGGALLGSTLVTAVDLPGGRRAVRLTVTPTRGRPGPPLADGPGAATLTAPAAKATFALVATTGAALDLSAMRLSAG